MSTFLNVFSRAIPGYAEGISAFAPLEDTLHYLEKGSDNILVRLAVISRVALSTVATVMLSHSIVSYSVMLFSLSAMFEYTCIIDTFSSSNISNEDDAASIDDDNEYSQFSTEIRIRNLVQGVTKSIPVLGEALYLTIHWLQYDEMSQIVARVTDFVRIIASVVMGIYLQATPFGPLFFLLALCSSINVWYQSTKQQVVLKQNKAIRRRPISSLSSAQQRSESSELTTERGIPQPQFEVEVSTNVYKEVSLQFFLEQLEAHFPAISSNKAHVNFFLALFDSEMETDFYSEFEKLEFGQKWEYHVGVFSDFEAWIQNQEKNEEYQLRGKLYVLYEGGTFRFELDMHHQIEKLTYALTSLERTDLPYFYAIVSEITGQLDE